MANGGSEAPELPGQYALPISPLSFLTAGISHRHRIPGFWTHIARRNHCPACCIGINSLRQKDLIPRDTAASNLHPFDPDRDVAFIPDREHLRIRVEGHGKPRGLLQLIRFLGRDCLVSAVPNAAAGQHNGQYRQDFAPPHSSNSTLRFTGGRHFTAALGSAQVKPETSI